MLWEVTVIISKVFTAWIQTDTPPSFAANVSCSNHIFTVERVFASGWSNLSNPILRVSRKMLLIKQIFSPTMGGDNFQLEYLITTIPNV